jgi:hypothetical protein
MDTREEELAQMLKIRDEKRAAQKTPVTAPTPAPVDPAPPTP